MHFPRVRVRVKCTPKGRVKVEIFKDETELIFMQIVTQNDDIEVIFMHITIPSLHFEYPSGLALGLGLGLSVYP
jgi:hypothetical protein